MRLVRSIGLLQIDSVNVLARAHLLPIFSRLGDYPVSVLDGAAWPRSSRDRLLVEAWAHVASLIPLSVQPLVRWRQEQFATEPWGRVDTLRRNHPGFLDTVLAVIAEQGPSPAGDIEKALEAPGRETSGWWEWSITKTACEYLFAVGAIGVAYRRGFERCYHLIERVLPPEILATPTPAVADAKRALLALAARSHGIGTVADLADYYRISVRSARIALAELVEEGEVTQVRVRGWKEPAFLHKDARIPRRVNGSALLCPFDPLIWARDRTERLFGTRYRIEIYVPAAQRQYGYYVLPLLVGEQIVGRFDLKADRATGRLLVQASGPSRTQIPRRPPTSQRSNWSGWPGGSVWARRWCCPAATCGARWPTDLVCGSDPLERSAQPRSAQPRQGQPPPRRPNRRGSTGNLPG